jgi:excisionase family DNA binding protein
MKIDIDENSIYTYEEVAKILRVHPQTILRNYIHRYGLKATRRGNRLYISGRDLKEFLTKDKG